MRAPIVAAAIAAFAFSLATQAHAQSDARPIELRPGLVITRSVRVVPRVYRLTAPSSLDSAVITIRRRVRARHRRVARLLADPEFLRPSRQTSPWSEPWPCPSRAERVMFPSWRCSSSSR